jgi:hypothetical protein
MNSNSIDPIAFVDACLAGRRLAPSTRKVAGVVASHLVLRAGAWRTIGLRKRALSDITGLSKATISDATKALSSGPDPIFAFGPALEPDPGSSTSAPGPIGCSSRQAIPAPFPRHVTSGLESPGEHGRRGSFSVSCTLDGPAMTSVLPLEITEPDRIDDAEEAALAERRARNDRALRDIYAAARARDDREIDPRRLFDAE